MFPSRWRQEELFPRDARKRAGPPGTDTATAPPWGQRRGKAWGSHFPRYGHRLAQAPQAVALQLQPPQQLPFCEGPALGLRHFDADQPWAGSPPQLMRLGAQAWLKELLQQCCNAPCTRRQLCTMLIRPHGQKHRHPSAVQAVLHAAQPKCRIWPICRQLGLERDPTTSQCLCPLFLLARPRAMKARSHSDCWGVTVQ